MKEKIESLAQAAKDLADKAQEKVGDGADAVRGAVGRIGDIGQIGSEAAQGVTDDLNELLPAIKRAGYKVQGIDLDLAIPPRIAVHCHLEAEVSGSDREALLASLSGHRIATTAIQALFQVSDLQKNLLVGTLKPSDVILELGVSPAVKVRYRERDLGITA
jgi:hypothetical protein